MSHPVRIITAALASMALLALAAGWYGWRDTAARLAVQGEGALVLAGDRLSGQLDRFRSLPRVVAGHPLVTRVLGGGEAETANRVLERIANATGALDIYLMDESGRTVASSNWNLERSFLGRDFGWRPYFIEAMRDGFGDYHAVGTTSGQRGFYFSAPVGPPSGRRGVVAVKVDMEVIEAAWEDAGDALFFTDANGVVFLSNRPALLFSQLTGFPAPEEPRQYSGVVLDPLDPRGEPGPAQTEMWNGPAGQGVPTPALWVHRDVPGLDLRAHTLIDPAPARGQALLLGGLGAALAGLIWLIAAILLMRRAAMAQRLRAEAEANAELERQVAARTAELSRANTLLRAEVAERTAAEARLREVQAELVQAGKLKALGEMSAGVSHELNQPLTAIRTLADNGQLLLERGKARAAAQNMGRIAELAARAARIIKNLRDFARKEGEPLADVDLNEVIAEALALAEPRMTQVGATVDWCRSPGPLTVRGGPVRLQQVVLNLITNAADAMQGQPRREITVSTEPHGDMLRLIVRDTGPGLIDPDRVFDPFFSTKEVGEGLGLGLSISYGLVQSFGGAIRGENAEDGGAVFTVDLRRAAARGEAAA